MTIAGRASERETLEIIKEGQNAMKMIILGASGFLVSWIYLKGKENNIAVIGTQHTSNCSDLMKIDIYNDHDHDKIINEKADVIIWCLMVGKNENNLIQNGLKPLIEKLPDDTKFIYVSSDVFSEGKGNYTEEDKPTYLDSTNPLSVYVNAKIDGELIVAEHKNHIIIRNGPIFGVKVNGQWDHRITSLIYALSKGQQYKRASNIFKTFVEVEQLAHAIVELAALDYCGVLHLGPRTKESYYSFCMKIATKLNLETKLIVPYDIVDDEARKNAIPLDTSLNTDRCRKILKTKFYELI